jgi:hypothetical protein
MPIGVGFEVCAGVCMPVGAVAIEPAVTTGATAPVPAVGTTNPLVPAIETGGIIAPESSPPHALKIGKEEAIARPIAEAIAEALRWWMCMVGLGIPSCDWILTKRGFCHLLRVRKGKLESKLTPY